MNLIEFRSIIGRMGLKSGDRVIINGGEATLHPALGDLLGELRKRGARSNLFTNGVLLSDFSYAEGLVQSGMDYVCIPVYGNSAELHDEMTRYHGSFEKICRAFDNLSKLKKNGHAIKIELKLLHCRATFRTNPSTAIWAAERFPMVDCISLNPPLYSGLAGKNIARFEADLKMTKDWIARAAVAIIENGARCSMPHIPYCLLPGSLHDDKWRRSFLPYPLVKPIYYFDVHETSGIVVSKREKVLESCLRCGFKGRCPGFSPHNLGKIF